MDTSHQKLWASAGTALRLDPNGNASRLYVESLNNMIDRHADRVASLRNRVPTSVMLLSLLGSAVAIAVLSAYIALVGRGYAATALAALLVLFILFVSFDLDRPDRGLIRIPDAPLVDVRAVMNLPPAVSPTP